VKGPEPAPLTGRLPAVLKLMADHAGRTGALHTRWAFTRDNSLRGAAGRLTASPLSLRERLGLLFLRYPQSLDSIGNQANPATRRAELLLDGRQVLE
jgi:hypothetical protein